MRLDSTNIDESIRSYLAKVDELEFPELHTDKLRFIDIVKRRPLVGGPYPGVSLFEASNRIFSDITALLAIYRLLADPVIADIRLPFSEYDVALGVEGGEDIIADDGQQRLVGEVFNVARTFFQQKKGTMLKKLRKNTDANFRLLIFNADAVRNPNEYFRKSSSDMLYLPVNIWEYRKLFYKQPYIQ
jgi:hypothetical protein